MVVIAAVTECHMLSMASCHDGLIGVGRKRGSAGGDRLRSTEFS